MSKSAAAVYSPPDPLTAFQSSSETIIVVGVDGKQHAMDLAAVDQIIYWACAGIANVKPELLIARSRKSLYSGMKANDVGNTLVMTAQPLIETEPGYSQVSARLLLDSLWDEVRLGLGQQTAHGGDFRAVEYPDLFKTTIRTGVELELLPESLLTFDLDDLSRALHPERDKTFTYPGLQTLYDSHFLQLQGTRLELPQIFFMRMAMERALNEEDPNTRAIEFYGELSRFSAVIAASSKS